MVAPSSIPRRGGKSVKTDRIDATELAEFYANGLLTLPRLMYSRMCLQRLCMGSINKNQQLKRKQAKTGRNRMKADGV